MKFKNLLFILGSVATATAINAATIVDGGFESPVLAGNDTLNIDTAPDVVNDLDNGWTTITGDVDIGASGGNPGQWADLSDDSPNINPQFMVNIFSAAVGGYTQDQVLQFDYELSGLSGTPDFSDNSISVELYGTNNNTQAYNTRISRSEIGTQWTAITTLSPDLTAATGGWQTAQATIPAATMNSYAYYGLRVQVFNVVDGGLQPGVEELKLDNFEIVPDSGGASDYAAWATANGIGGEPAGGDFDLDGHSNLIEYAIAGLDPTVPDGAIETFDGTTVSYAKRAEAVANGDVTYAIEASSDLGATVPWAAVTPTVDDGSTIAYDVAATPREFARLNVSLVE